MRIKIYVPDIECDSCVLVLEKKFKTVKGVNSIHPSHDTLEIDYDETQIKQNNILGVIQNAGFRASLNPFDRKSFKERFKDVKENKKKYDLEIRGIKYTLAAFGILLGLHFFAYLGFLKYTPDFIRLYGWWILYLDISIVTLATAIWHFYSYKAKITCMVGMMIGMTIGMQSGMMIGAIIGATNGFFIGCMAGMLLGVIVGAITGKCCGVMGIMEGMMAGLMGGTMGPMISVMMFSDNLLWFMPFYMIINILIVAGLSYMLFEEVVEHKKVEKVHVDFVTYIASCVFLAGLLSVIMLYAPKSALLI